MLILLFIVNNFCAVSLVFELKYDDGTKYYKSDFKLNFDVKAAQRIFIKLLASFKKTFLGQAIA